MGDGRGLGSEVGSSVVEEGFGDGWVEGDPLGPSVGMGDGRGLGSEVGSSVVLDHESGSGLLDEEKGITDIEVSSNLPPAVLTVLDTE